MKTVEFWFEFASTYSYPAAMRIEQLAEQHSAAVRWRPFLLGPIFKAQGWADSPFNLYEAKGRYMWRDLERICAEQGIPWRKPSIFPRNGLLAARVACLAEGQKWLSEFATRVYQANFVHNLDIGGQEVVRTCLNGLAANRDHLIQEAQTDGARQKLRANGDRAKQLGIFGAPTCVVGTELFWGNDRLEAALGFLDREDLEERSNDDS